MLQIFYDSIYVSWVELRISRSVEENRNITYDPIYHTTARLLEKANPKIWDQKRLTITIENFSST